MVFMEIYLVNRYTYTIDYSEFFTLIVAAVSYLLL